MSFERFRRYTQARVGLGRAGAALPTREWLNFSYQHAAAVDAINVPWDLTRQRAELADLGLQTDVLNTQVTGREEYLLRPEKGRRLDAESEALLRARDPTAAGEILLLASNGLSSLAVQTHLTGLLRTLLPSLAAEGFALCDNRIWLAPNGRVGLIDHVGELLQPPLGLMLIGERPGLSSPDGLAVYLTFQPRLGLSDAERNCISNIRVPHGLSYETAAFKTTYLVREALRRRISGVRLKDESSSTERLAEQRELDNRSHD